MNNIKPGDVVVLQHKNILLDQQLFKVTAVQSNSYFGELVSGPKAGEQVYINNNNIQDLCPE